MKNKKSNFEIQTKLGSGSYGVIFKALNKTSKEVCVLKQIALGRLNEKARRSAVNEATIMGKLSHPFVVRYEQSFMDENTLNIVMEYCDNGDLSVFLKMQNKKPLKEEKIWKFFIQICSGLEYIHRNKILHRDIKTLNMFLNKNEEVKIGDLGVAKMLTSNEFAQTMVGTPFYLSPQLCEEKPYNEKSDIWALGCLLYELCTYQHPFEAQNQASLILKIIRGKYNPIPEFYSKELKDMIDMCLERDYKRRPTAANILARPKIKDFIVLFKIQQTIHDFNLKYHQQKDQKKNQVVQKVMDKPGQEKKNIKQEPSKQAIKTIEEPVKKEVILQKKQEKIGEKIIVNKANQKQKDILQSKRQSKDQFSSNLQKMIDDDKNKKNYPPKPPSYFQIPWKNSDKVNIPLKSEKIVKIQEKVAELKFQKKLNGEKVPQTVPIQNPFYNDKKRSTPSLNAELSPKIKLQEKAVVNMAKPPLMPAKPSAISQQNNDQITKVKMEKNIPSKVYQSQKNMAKPPLFQIKSGGFVEVQKSNQSKQKQRLKSQKDKDSSKIFPKRPSVTGLNKNEKEESKILFGPSPSYHHKSQKKIINDQLINASQQRKPIQKNIFQNPHPFSNKYKEQDNSNKVSSRVRKGGKNQLARNAKNVSRYNEVTKEEEDLVINLPNKLKNSNESSDESEGEAEAKENITKNIIRDIKTKTAKQFKLKDINDDLILQKYEDIMNSVNSNEKTSEEEEQNKENVKQQQFEDENQNEQNTSIIYDSAQQLPSFVEREHAQQVIHEDVPSFKKKHSSGSEAIEEMLEQQNYSKVVDEIEENVVESEEDQSLWIEAELENASEWSFDEEPQLPLLEERQSPYFEENNLYEVEQEEKNQDKKQHLQIKLKENMKREDQINKLMQIKIDQCKQLVSNTKNFQEILQFFRKKINMDSEYTEQDQKEVEIFLKKKGLTDNRKFQNIYKIMHFQMELENTRTIIQTICKKLNQLEDA